MKLVRTRQSPVMWIIDVLLTLLAWGGLVWLLARGIGAMLETHGGPRIEAPIFAALNTLQIYLWIALFNALILIGWARYQQRRGRQFAQRRAEANALSDKHLSESFNLGDGHLEQFRKPGVLVIHNNEEGGVEDVKSHVSRDVERPGLALVPGTDKDKGIG
ncbi:MULTISPECIES: poly-beta-1,6-N-acetyl-D-glucosamine biosynthesis protein PgaD [Pseudomonas]|uniref:Biofilm PGA synthesis auxiliary protein PgaD n=4 Tax=Pseudomonas TaxID=286 RepID=A0A0R2YFQ5_9PSED|nr:MULTISPECIES: poly-beta-1,6-N-acetyl-D-glucosamine biosynthesis protein PgaD [Pseudomonas]AKA83751.1 Biofilm PGA synthesis auxiliary protein PgaD [Pseudomonas synxantha]AMS19569.1 poly-beta-1,6-N-acetyl-D-glucosamine biosynthesis protein PgaD [Pseudomonas synxantha]AZE58567.1 Biofilm PGA synthesis auxiliary protein PgaD [Pseudomonas synxantha]AZE64388.1 Biofilm PGA synthesis auxiliary protein PgaD [Pseudomonas synxantha]AZE75973.1 Biofilm PGA synthesis auxiliary protein PgaD [Pseudomonas sy